jgi:putative addiction module component (TIGR02574 family)
MTVRPNYAHLEVEVLHLPREDRSKLASRLLESLDDDDFQPSPEWTDELKRRTTEMDEGRAKMIPARSVWDGINGQLGTHF